MRAFQRRGYVEILCDFHSQQLKLCDSLPQALQRIRHWLRGYDRGDRLDHHFQSPMQRET